MEKEYFENVCIITVEKKQIDVNNASEFGSDLLNNITGEYSYILDLGNVSFIDSSGLGKIVAGLRKANELNVAFVICNVNQAVDVLFKMVRLSQIATLYATRAEAVEQVRSA